MVLGIGYILATILLIIDLLLSSHGGVAIGCCLRTLHLFAPWTDK